MKKLLKKIGKFFIALSQKEERDIRQPILLVEGSFILPNNFALIIKGVKKKFKNANLVVLTFKDKKEFIRDNFPDVEIIVPESKIQIKRYQLAIQLFFLLRKNFNFIILSSLDISLVLISLLFAKCPVFLHNRWGEWYRIRQRTLLDVLRRVRSTDKNRRRNNGIKDILKTFGRIFVILSDMNAEDIKYNILIEDNGYTEIGHVLTAVRRTEEIFINPDITLLTIAERKQHFINSFPQMKLVALGENSNRNSLADQMYRMRKDKCNYVVLTTLDIAPILISFVFFRAEVLLYNRWHQWWSLDFKNIWVYFKGVLSFVVMIPVLIYLLITASLILLRTGFRLGLINLKSIFGRRDENRY